MNHRLSSTAVSFVIAAGLGACGGDGGDASGDDTAAISSAIERSLTQIDKSLCTETFTQNFLEEATGKKGEEAVKVCEASAANADPSGAPTDIEVSDVTVDGATAKATVSYSDGDVRSTDGVELVNEDGEWKIDKSQSDVEPEQTGSSTDTTAGG